MFLTTVSALIGGDYLLFGVPLRDVHVTIVLNRADSIEPNNWQKKTNLNIQSTL